jgi:transglutaminase-like putative cysteine protease
MRRRFRITYTATIRSRSSNEACIWLAQPSTDHGQKVEQFTTSMRPTRIYTSRETTVLASPIVRGSVARVQFEMIATLRTLPAPVHIRLPRAASPENLRMEPSLERPHWIRQIAADWAGSSRMPSEALRRAYAFVARSMTYTYPVQNRGIRFLDPVDLRGDCGESAGLLVALARAMRIPARPEVGYVISPGGRVAEHAWASVRLTAGWRDIDPQYASLESSPAGVRRYFLRRPDYRLVTTRGYNISLRPAVPRGFLLETLQQDRTPMNRASVQTLQPIALASRYPTSVQQELHAEPLSG